MELKEPKKKRWCNLESEQPFPIFIQSEIGIPIKYWVPFLYTGVYNGLGVIVRDPSEINALHGMGNFGKGCSSRSRPIIMRNTSHLPPIIPKRQYHFRRRWVEGATQHTKESSPSLADELLDSISSLLTKIDNISDEQSRGIQVVDETNGDKAEVMNISSDDESECMTSANDVQQECTTPSTQENIEQDIDQLTFPLNSLVVISDSESEICSDNLNPKLCIDNSKCNEYLVLSLQEAYFLAFGLGCLQILDEHDKVFNLQESWKIFCENENNFAHKYIVYHYYRSKGWIVKPGIKFGGDYLLYKEGQPYYHASYIVVIDNNNTLNTSDCDWMTILGLLRMSVTAAKDVLIVQVSQCDTSESIDLSSNPSSISKYQVSEMLFRRWISNQERDHDL